jgi:hypothetical protein
VFASDEIRELIRQEIRPPAKGSRLPSLEVLDRKAILFAIRRRLNPDAKKEIRHRYERNRHVLHDEKRLIYEEPN